MERGSFLLASLLGIAVSVSVFFPLGAKRRSYIPLAIWWFCLILGGITCLYGLSHSTAPSFAPRITSIGKTYDYVEHRQGRDTYYGFRFEPPGGESVNIETAIILPDWNSPALFDGRTFRVVYLQDTKRTLKNEAIDIEILAGQHAGYHGSLDARAVGAWLGVPIGSAFLTFGLFGLRYRKDDVVSRAGDRITENAGMR